MGRKEVVMPGCVEKKGKGQLCVIASGKLCYLELRKRDNLLHDSIFWNHIFLIVLFKSECRSSMMEGSDV